MRSDLPTPNPRRNASSRRHLRPALAVAVAVAFVCVALVAGSSTAAETTAARQVAASSVSASAPTRSTSGVSRAVRAVRAVRTVSAASRLTVSAVGPTSISLRWKQSSDPKVTRYRVLLNGQRSLTTASSKATVKALACGTAYQVGVAAVGSSGGTSRTLSLTTATRACADRTKPSAPGAIVVLTRATDALTVSWGTAKDNVGVVRYDVLLNAKKAGSTATTSYSFSKLQCNQSYTIGVRAVDGAGNTSPTTSTLVSTLPCPADAVPPVSDPPPPATPPTDTTPPSQPSLSITAATTSAITVAWTAASDNVAVTGYGVYVGSTLIGTTSSLTRVATGLTCGASYTIGVEAYDGAGNTSSRSTVVASTSPCTDTSAPTNPSGLGVVTTNETSASLSWSPSSDNVGVVGYGVYRGGLLVGEVSTTAYVLTGLSCGTTYSIGVDAVDGSANRSGTATTFFSTSACPDTAAPTAPSGLATTSTSTSSLATSWNAATDNVGVAGYGIYLNGNRLTNQSGRSYSFGSLACGTSYTLGVDAYDAAGNRSAKTTLAATTSSCPTTPPPTSSANLVVSTSGNDSTCTRNNASTPCASLNGAYAKAQGGDLIEIAGGTYGGQSLSSRSLGSTDVRFRPASGAFVTLNGLSINTSHVDISGLRVDGGTAIQTTSGATRPSFVTLRGLTSKWLFIAADDVNVLGGSVGGFSACAANTMEDGVQIWLESPSTPPRRVTLDGVTVHDVTDNGNNCDGTAQSGRHVDCIQILSGQYVTIRNSRFYGCATSNILAQPYIAPLDHITIENNFFGPPVRSGNNVYLGGGTCTAVVYRFNTSPDMGVTGGCSDPIAAYGNIMKNWSCTSGVTYSDNVFVPGSVTCGSNTRQCAPTFAASSLSSADYHLSGTDSCARDGVRPASYPATDADGQARPSGASPDAGADETG